MTWKISRQLSVRSTSISVVSLTPDRNEEPMSTLSITAGPFTFRAGLEEERAPKTCEAFSKLLPFEQKVVHIHWSGHGAQDIVFTAD